MTELAKQYEPSALESAIYATWLRERAFAAEPDEELTRLSAQQNLADLPGERIWDEINRLLLKARRPSLGLAFLERTGLLRYWKDEIIVGLPRAAI